MIGNPFINLCLKTTDLKRYSIKAATEVRKRKHLRGGKRLVLRLCVWVTRVHCALYAWVQKQCCS